MIYKKEIKTKSLMFDINLDTLRRLRYPVIKNLAPLMLCFLLMNMMQLSRNARKTKPFQVSRIKTDDFIDLTKSPWHIYSSHSIDSRGKKIDWNFIHELVFERHLSEFRFRYDLDGEYTSRSHSAGTTVGPRGQC